jgi:hypothetical protein
MHSGSRGAIERREGSVLQFVDGVDHSGPRVAPTPVAFVDPVVEALHGAHSRLPAMPLDHLAGQAVFAVSLANTLPNLQAGSYGLGSIGAAGHVVSLRISHLIFSNAVPHRRLRRTLEGPLGWGWGIPV